LVLALVDQRGAAGEWNAARLAAAG
jgi:hypothetical protein